VPDTLLRAGEREFEPLFVLAQRGLGAFPVAEIEMRADDTHDRSTGLAAYRKTTRQHVNVMAVLVSKPELGLVGGPCAAGDAVVRLVGARPIVWMHQALPRADVRL